MANNISRQWGWFIYRQLLTLLCLSLPPNVAGKEAGNYYFSHITGENGLSQSNVKTILQDSYGFMWFGTKNGLNRYDGTSIKILRCEDPVLGKGNNNISALFEDDDRKLWVGTDKGVYLYDPVLEAFHAMDVATAEGKQMTNWVSDIRSDEAGNIWIVIPDEGVFRYHAGKLYQYDVTDGNHYASEYPECMCVTASGEVWIGTFGAGLYEYDPAADTFRQHLADRHGNTFKNDHIFSICEYGSDLVVAAHEGQLKKYHRAKQEIRVVDAPEVHYSVLRAVACFDGELWVGTQAGLFIINEEKGKVTHLKEDLMHPYSLSDKTVYTIYRDREGGIWLGTVFGGVNYLPSRRMVFEKYMPSAFGCALSSKRIRELAEDAYGHIWITTDDGGMNVLDTKTGHIAPLAYAAGRKDRQNTLAIAVIGQQVWFGTFKQGIDVISLPSGSHREYPGTALNLEESSVYAMLEDRAGRVWLGTGRGLYVAPPGEMRFERVTQTGHEWIFHLMEDSDGQLWIATMGNGVYKYNPGDGSYLHYAYHAGDSTGLSSSSVSDIMQDSRGRIWFSTDRGGLCLYDKEKDRFTTYSVADGLPDDMVYRVLEDGQHYLWFGTNRGLVKFHPDTRETRVYTKSDGLPENQFNYKSALKAGNGKFYFGSIGGLIAFDPEQEGRMDFTPPVYITKMRIYNSEITVHSEDSPLERSIIHTDLIVLPYHRSNISFDFVALSYDSPSATQYQYKMEGLDREWITAASNRNITYSKLPPGNYRFVVQATNRDASWTDARRSLAITILPPWWLSLTAFVVYTLLAIGLIAGWLYWYGKRQQKRMLEAQKLFEIEKEKELYSSKIAFFTEIAHEVRTPLTLINGPLENLLEMNLQDRKVIKNLQVIAQNTKRLLELTRQLLDFRKVGANKFLLDFMMLNVARLLHEIVDRFEPTIHQKGKTLTLHMPEEDITAAVDKEAFTKIVSNLLNNALKYAAHHIEVRLTKESTSFSISVSSDGDRIPEELSARIFEPFFRINRSGETSGAGIGLPLARSLSELHQGRLYLDPHSRVNTFILTLPLNQEKVIHLEDGVRQNEYIAEETWQPVSGIDRQTVLLVEDSESLSTFMVEKLQESFVVEVAGNGVEALEILKNKHVDIVISDVMMPRMGGFELCRAIKSDVELSHIPFIFLTAKNDLDSKINGLKTGAEAYVEKPFSFNYLYTQIVTLLTNRRKEREAFAKRPFFPVHNMHMNRADEEFMDRIIGVIHGNLSDGNFKVEHLAEILCMSRSSLLRKIKALTNLSPVDFIRLIRLKKAAELILEGKYRMGEICDQVGIHSPSYFSKLFLQQFGMTPKDFANQNQYVKSD
ncbi:MAG: response regulator [Tannerella sp.]|jgi:ligand-binding sensor domain-containing protein/signal transduction histidine kinase/DNA-binding response OmpR family regulator|nr:response regulator [Tannerella sp.]